MTKHCILNSTNVVVNIISAENPVTKEEAEVLTSSWNEERNNWIESGKIGQEPILPNFWTIQEGTTLGPVPTTWEACGIGYTWSGTDYIPPPEPEPVVTVPKTISDRQFFQGLANLGKITQQEALAAVKTGDIPAAMETFISTMDANTQFDVRMNLSGATQFNRDHILVDTFGQFMAMTPQQLDELWIYCATL